MSISLSGLLSGIDTSTLITQLIEIEKQKLVRYQTRQQEWQQKEDALNEVETQLSTLNTALKALYDADDLKAFSTASSDTDIVTAEASSNSFEGNHSIEISQLANAERWVHTAGLEYAEDFVGAGTFIYSYNNTETSVTTTADTTLEDLVGLINNDANNPGISASLLYYNDAYHLVLNGNDAGTDYEISVNSSNTEVWQTNSEFTVDGENASASTLLTKLDQFGSNPLQGGEVIEITGTDHNGNAIAQVNLNVTANTKISHIISEINDAFEGIAKAKYENGEIILTDLTSGTSDLSIDLNFNANGSAATMTLPTMSVQTEGGSITASLGGFDSSDFTETQSAQDSLIRVDGYPSDDWISRSSNTIDDVIQGVTLHLHDTGSVQVNLTRDIESVKEKLNTMIEAYNSAVSYIAENTTYDSDTETAGVLMADYIVSTIKSQLRVPLITQSNGFIQDIDSFINPGHIGLEVDRDGYLSLDETVFDEAIAEDYMAVLDLIGADKTGTSDSNDIEFYGASSDYTTAGTYDVLVEFDASGNISSARIKLEGEDTYREMTLSGNVAIGNSTFSGGQPVYAENGLSLTVPLTGTPSSTISATVYVKQGFTGQMQDAIDRMLKYSTGTLQIDQAQASNQIDELQDKIDREQDRVDKKEERLIARYARLEKQLALLESQMSALGL